MSPSPLSVVECMVRDLWRSGIAVGSGDVGDPNGSDAGEKERGEVVYDSVSP